MSTIDDPARDDAALAAGPLHPAGAPTAAAEFESGTRAALMRRFTLCEILLVCGVALALAGTLLQIHYVRLLQALVAEYGWGKVPRELVFDGVRIDLATRVLNLAGYAMAISAFFTGMARARRIAGEVLGARFEYGFGWTVGSLFIPIICLFRPWVGLAEIRGKFASAGNSGDGATWALAVATFIGGGADFVLSMALKGPAVPSAASFVTWSENTLDIFMAITAAKGVTYGALILYLITLHRPLRQVTRQGQILACFE